MPASKTTVTIRQAVPSDFEAIWPFFQRIIQQGETFSYPATATPQEAQSLWMPENASVYVALLGETVCGSYYLKPNQPGRGSHVANAGYMVNPDYSGQGLGRMLGEHSIETARQLGYQAMQFNFVVSTNTPAVKLWQSLGFTIIGTTPGGFQHPRLGLVDTYILYQAL